MGNECCNLTISTAEKKDFLNVNGKKEDETEMKK
jgi:hypothetical protein